MRLNRAKETAQAVDPPTIKPRPKLRHIDSIRGVAV